jgi:hypothetical protein
MEKLAQILINDPVAGLSFCDTEYPKYKHECYHKTGKHLGSVEPCKKVEDLWDRKSCAMGFLSGKNYKRPADVCKQIGLEGQVYETCVNTSVPSPISPLETIPLRDAVIIEDIIHRN